MTRQQSNLSKNPIGRCVIALLLGALLHGRGYESFADDATQEAARASKHFSEVVLPLLKKRCYECHSHAADSAEGGLVLDSRAGWKLGGDSGPAIVPGRSEKSLLLTAVEYSDPELQMPPDSKLPAREIAILKDWIANGAFDSRVTEPGQRTGNTPAIPQPKDLWSLQPIEMVEVPETSDDARVRNDIDRFVLAKLIERRLEPNQAANKFALLRRAAFDLTGLPPTLSEIDDFVSDDRADAYKQLVDRLLKSPHYGERWGRHWLDLARYGDSNGGDINYAHANAWKYRDYVIKSFNDDKPYDAFIREQLAGDLLPDGGNAEVRRELLTATGFLMLGPKMLAEADTDKLLIDIVDEQLDVTGLTFLGMTFGCARCHNHKFDPISTEDYYAMAGIFRSTKVIDVFREPGGVSEWLEVDVTPAETRATIEKLNDEKQRVQELLAELGALEKPKSNASNKANKAILAPKLPQLKSTTWAAWARLNSPQRLGAVVSATYAGADQGHSLGFDNGSTPRIVWNHGEGSHTIIAAARPIPFEEWHHIALTFDAAAERLRLFVDGSPAATASDVATSHFSTISVGRREASRQWQFNGDVDEVQIFSTALTEAEVEALAKKRATGSVPLIHWTFDRIVSDAVVGAEQGGVDGRLVGASTTTGVIKDGVIGAAFSFEAAGVVSKQDAERTRKITGLRKQVKALEARMPAPSLVMSVGELSPVDLAVHLRGSHLKLASTVMARSTPKVFEDVLTPVAVPQNENGRLQLADWIASPKNPLTARVMVNRIWQYHFGTGLVRTSSNFGVRGELPSHPELLDWLARKFVESGWSVKHMHRLIMNSATYRQSSQFNADIAERDPENRLLGKYPVRRLEAEAARDSLLAATGELDRTVGGSLFKSENKKRVTMSPVDPVYASFRRSVYLPSVRVRSYQMFSIFDVSDSGQHVARRPQTLVAQQALFLMNNPLVTERAKELARQVTKQQAHFNVRADWLHRLLFGRPATDRETSTLSEVFSELTDSALAGAEAAIRKDKTKAALFAWEHVIHAMLCSNEFIHIR
jgi:hypothetical protein